MIYVLRPVIDICHWYLVVDYIIYCCQRSLWKELAYLCVMWIYSKCFIPRWPWLTTHILLYANTHFANKCILIDFSDISHRGRCIKLLQLLLSFRIEMYDFSAIFICGKVNCSFSNFIKSVYISPGRRPALKGILLTIPRVNTTIF